MIPAPKPRPEKTFGPYPDALSITVWLNPITTSEGTKLVRSMTLSRRYKDQKSGEWKDATSFTLAQLRVIRLAITDVEQFVQSTPVPSHLPANGGSVESALPPPDGGEGDEQIPF